MRAEDMSPNHVGTREINATVVRKDSLAAFFACMCFMAFLCIGGATTDTMGYMSNLVRA